SDDRRVVHVGTRRVVVDEAPAPGQQARVLHALHRLPDPALRDGGCRRGHAIAHSLSFPARTDGSQPSATRQGARGTRRRPRRHHVAPRAAPVAVIGIPPRFAPHSPPPSGSRRASSRRSTARPGTVFALLVREARMKPNDITDGGRAWRQQDSVRQPGGTSRKRRRPQSALVVAATGLLLARWFGHPAREGVASIAIGAILMTVSFLLARETLGLLTGESADPGTIRSIRAIAEADPSVARVGQALTALRARRRRPQPRALLPPRSIDGRGGRRHRPSRAQ